MSWLIMDSTEGVVVTAVAAVCLKGLKVLSCVEVLNALIVL